MNARARTYYVIAYESRHGPRWLRLTSHGMPRGSRRELTMIVTRESAGTWRDRGRADDLCAGAQLVFPGARVVAQEAA